MGSFKFINVAIIVAMLVPSISAVDYLVGDDAGWTVGFDYQTWAQDKMFFVGDRLVFNYPAGVHNVFKVNGTDFRQCTTPVGAVPLTSGNDVITLATPGRKWYLCGVSNHCSIGQKLSLYVMTVQIAWSPISPPSPAPSPFPAYI
ncbi:blue copper protein 1b-like [Humulus lupulus]|uniref:blue copper protein 1b-like n=1 Tax=Humulus lupulus TaxID=3486 RepID=UPI002B4084FB|nr:blue copper protein 1b-like [Humulus lupulus]